MEQFSFEFISLEVETMLVMRHSSCERLFHVASPVVLRMYGDRSKEPCTTFIIL